MRVLSLGAGVQSTTLALLSKHGELEPLDCAIFADTGWEPKAVYRHLDWLEGQLPFPVYRVSNENIREHVVTSSVYGERYAGPPYRTANGGLLRRECTAEFKIVPINRKLRELLGLKPRQRAKETVEQWLGISWDESRRAVPAQEKWINRRWPLMERYWTRQDCLRWLMSKGYPMPPKSACIGCPYHCDNGWATMKLTDPEAFADAVEIDHLIRNKVKGVREVLYTHRSLRPLDEVDFTNAEDHGQQRLSFETECPEGICGV